MISVRFLMLFVSVVGEAITNHGVAVIALLLLTLLDLYVTNGKDPLCKAIAHQICYYLDYETWFKKSAPPYSKLPRMYFPSTIICCVVGKPAFHKSHSGISQDKRRRLDCLGDDAFQHEVHHFLTPEEKLALMYEERQRWRTFAGNWPLADLLKAEDMAKAGFFRLADGSDRVQCVFCRGVLHNWLPGDRPMEEHSKHFRNCRLVRGQPCGNVPYNPKGDELDKCGLTGIMLLSPGGTTAADLGISTHQPFSPNLSSGGSRLRTFERFPANCPVPAGALCEAGFYYTGIDDKVKCFHCDGMLEQWKRGDDPWEAHARFFPTCGFLRSDKGGEYIRKVKRAQNIPQDANYYQGMISTCIDLGYSKADCWRAIHGQDNTRFRSTRDMLIALHALEDGDVAMGDDELPNNIPTCRICGVVEATRLALPCGCLAVCKPCSERPLPPCCPKCSVSMRGLLRIYMP